MYYAIVVTKRASIAAIAGPQKRRVKDALAVLLRRPGWKGLAGRVFEVTGVGFRAKCQIGLWMGEIFPGQEKHQVAASFSVAESLNSAEEGIAEGRFRPDADGVYRLAHRAPRVRQPMYQGYVVYLLERDGSHSYLVDFYAQADDASEAMADALGRRPSTVGRLIRFDTDDPGSLTRALVAWVREIVEEDDQVVSVGAMAARFLSSWFGEFGDLDAGPDGDPAFRRLYEVVHLRDDDDDP